MNPILTRPILGAALLLTVGAAAHAATLSVDIDNDTATPATQSGYISYRVSNATELRTTFNYADTLDGSTMTFVLTGLSGDNNRDRGTGNLGGVTNADLYRDLLFDNGTGGADAFDITFSGLLANSDYQFKFFAFDPSNSGNSNTFTLNPLGATFGGVGGTFYDTAGASATGLGTVNAGGPAGNPTSNDQYAIVISGRTNASGNIGFTQTGNGFPTLNGFEVTSVPEPSALMAVLSGAAVLLGFRRRKPATA